MKTISRKGTKVQSPPKSGSQTDQEIKQQRRKKRPPDDKPKKKK
jgi:hypothetical protein